MNPESGTVNYSYDGNGNLLSKKDARAITTNYSYDALNRVTAKSYSDGTTPSVSYSYDTGAAGYPIGRLTQVSNANTVTNYTSYDALGRTTGSNQSQGGQVYSFSYAYNLAGSLTSETYPSGRVVVTGYDGANRATSVTGTFNQAQTNYLSNAAYSPHGAPTGYTYGNTSMPGFTYNNRLQPNQVYATVPNTNNIDNGAQLFLYYLWLNWGNTTNNGNLLQLDEKVSSAAAPYSSLTTYGENFSYDAANRLVSASDSGGWTRNFAYDQYGNGWVTGATGISLNLMEPTSGGLYNSKNQISSSPYDANGNMTALPPGMTFTYDAENHQTAESNSDGMSATYLYDGDGRRVQKALASGQTTIYVYDAQGDLAAEYDKNPPAPMCRTCYLNYDHLGSIRLVTDQNANIVARHSYLPFGEEVPGGSAGRSTQFDASDNISQRFTGKERDSETSLDYFGARYYGAGMGRWVSLDKLNLTSLRLLKPTNTLNKYVYGGNNSLKYVDRDGEDITIFYRPSSGSFHLDFGHIYLGALNQNTGKVGFLDFYPAGPLHGSSGPGAFNEGNMQDRAGQVDQYATLTIQTSPEQAQKLLDLIAKLKGGGAPTYDAFSTNCSTVCEDVLHDLGLDFGDILPGDFFRDAFGRYGAAGPGTYDNLIPDRIINFMPGKEYGNPRNVGMDFTHFLFQVSLNQLQSNQEPRACVETIDSASRTRTKTCN